ncbi:MAG: 4Fe-4S binding protein [Clostridia bacterium]|nr:4Fe-4S binding protein [Clostridia bacterium]
MAKERQFKRVVLNFYSSERGFVYTTNPLYSDTYKEKELEYDKHESNEEIDEIENNSDYTEENQEFDVDTQYEQEYVEKNEQNEEYSEQGDVNDEPKEDDASEKNSEKTDTPPQKKAKRSFKERLKSLIPSRRRIIQLYSALLFNANIKGYITGNIFDGATKNLCTPGLNCYSCPGATTACPLGSLQGELNKASKKTPMYVLGILLLYGMLLGRFICGFLCPFGLVQELFFKIKTPKLKKNRVTRVLSYFKYVILIFFVVIVPILYGLKDVALPAFCAYICPAGTIGGALGLLSNAANEWMFPMLGPLFTWKFLLLVSFVVGSIFIYRIFCRFICPLGAIYGIFNKISLFGIKLEKPKCTNCGLCVTKCKMDIKHVGDHECISCGECIDVCPTKAISWKGSKIFLAPDEIDTAANINNNNAEQNTQGSDDATKKKKRVERRKLIFKIVAGVLMSALLIGALVYYNFIDTPAEEPPVVDDNGNGEGDELVVGNEVGNLAPDFELEIFDANGPTGVKFNPANNKGKITIINFWGTWCTPCVEELPYFDEIASKYKDNVTVVAVHTVYYLHEPSGWISEKYPNTEMVFVRDIPLEEGSNKDMYYTTMGGKNSTYPMTVILDENGVIIEHWPYAVKLAELEAVVKEQLQKTEK